MILYVLMGQRACRYAGEYAPEALAVMDEFGQSDNPDYLEQQMEIYTKSNEFSSLKLIAVNVDGKLIAEILSPTIPAISGKVEEVKL